MLHSGFCHHYLKPAEAHPQRAGLRRDDHDRGVGPVGGGDAGHKVGNAGPVLRDANACLVGHPGFNEKYLIAWILKKGKRAILIHYYPRI